MPKLPDWASKGQIVYDTILPLVFIKHGGRSGRWVAYETLADGLRAISMTSVRTLDEARRRILAEAGKSITRMVIALHPYATYRHMYVSKTTKHACGIPYAETPTAYQVSDVTCPLCLTVIEAEVSRKVADTDPTAIATARERVQAINTLNGLATLVAKDADKLPY